METVAANHMEQWCRQTDRLATELSSTWCDIESADLADAIAPTLKHIGEATNVDRTSIVEFNPDGDTTNAYQWSDPTLAVEGHDADGIQPLWLWERLRPDQDALVLEHIPADVPMQSLTPAVFEQLRERQLRSALVMPVRVSGELTCALSLETIRDYHAWPEPLIERLRVIASVLGNGLYRRRQDTALRQSQAELDRLLRQLEHEKEPFEEEVHEPAAMDFEDIIGKSPSLRAALVRVQEVAPTVSSVLLLGETGTGKELFARAIHAHGPRRSNPLVVVNCAALPPTLIESELFGHARGAFTGAVATRQGRFELAHRGTLFLDEIGDLPIELQTKLLRVLQEGSFERLGSSMTQKVDVRIIAATHRDLAATVAEGAFREDLYYRLSVFPIRLPPLRERREDIRALVWAIIHKRQRPMHRWIKRVPDNVMEMLERHDWPGNVRELENVIERALIHSSGDTLRLLDDHFDRLRVDQPRSPDDTTLTSVERTHIEEVLRSCRWRINGPGNAAERLGLHPNTLRFRMKKLGIIRETPSRAGVQVASG